MSGHHTITQAVQSAAQAPHVQASAAGAGLASIGDWLSTGPGLATAIGVGIAAASFLLQLWLGAREDRRKQARHEAEMRAMELRR